MSGLGLNDTIAIKHAEMKSRQETLKRMRKIHEELRKNPHVQLGLAGLQFKATIGEKQATLINKGFKAAASMHKFSERFGMNRQCAQLSFPCAKTNRKTIKSLIEKQNFECSLMDLLTEQGVAVPQNMEFQPVGGFRRLGKCVEKCLKEALVDDFDAGIHMPDMIDRIEDVNGEKQLHVKFQLLHSDGFGHKNIKEIFGLPDSTGELRMFHLQLNSNNV